MPHPDPAAAGGAGGPRVLLASRVFAPEPAAAAQRLAALAAALTAAGARVEVLTSRPTAAVRRAAGTAGAGGARVRRWPVLRDRSGVVRGYLPYASFDVPLLARLLLARRPDVVVVEPPPTTGAVVAAACALRGVPFVYYAADLLSVAAADAGAARPVLVALRALEGAVLRRAALVLAVSEAVAERVRDLGAAPGVVEVVGAGADVATFTEGPAGAEEELLVYAGTMSEVHGAGVFLDAFARVAERRPRARLVMYGGGVEREELLRRAAALPPGRVELPGTVPAAEVAAALRRARAGLASLRPGGYAFAVVTKTFAATACGTPVVYAGPGPCADLVRRHDLGWAVPHEAGAVAVALEEALGAAPDPARRRRLAGWTRREASLPAVGARAARAVLGVCAPRSTRRTGRTGQTGEQGAPAGGGRRRGGAVPCT
ncbi:glycosyltransferase [Kineococcus indalonis]|uniref:glycosyltransferase n=1 Tax=Kineococcus indalonis TaxID=2696566 RepID=UPI0014126682|nr:glycosyltransferase [Kineococcus indalonis]NAZ88052.1 glycosyltransferase [Kineococcus indalonis]